MDSLGGGRDGYVMIAVAHSEAIVMPASESTTMNFFLKTIQSAAKFIFSQHIIAFWTSCHRRRS